MLHSLNIDKARMVSTQNWAGYSNCNGVVIPQIAQMYLTKERKTTGH